MNAKENIGSAWKAVSKKCIRVEKSFAWILYQCGRERTELVIQNIIELASEGGLKVSEEDIKNCCSHMVKS